MKRLLLSAIALLLMLSGVAMLVSCDDDSMEDSSFKPVSTSVETGGEDPSSDSTENGKNEEVSGTDNTTESTTESTTSATTSGDQWSQDRK